MPFLMCFKLPTSHHAVTSCLFVVNRNFFTHKISSKQHNEFWQKCLIKQLSTHCFKRLFILLTTRWCQMRMVRKPQVMNTLSKHLYNQWQVCYFSHSVHALAGKLIATPFFLEKLQIHSYLAPDWMECVGIFVQNKVNRTTYSITHWACYSLALGP